MSARKEAYLEVHELALEGSGVPADGALGLVEASRATLYLKLDLHRIKLKHAVKTFVSYNTLSEPRRLIQEKQAVDPVERQGDNSED